VPAKPHPLSVSAYYLSAARPGRAQVSTRVLREGGSVATVSAELGQEGVTRISALATYGDLRAMPDDVATTAAPPTLPPVEECVPGSLAPEETRRVAPVMERFDMRFDPACVGWATDAPSGRGHIQAWLRMADGHDVDPVGLLMVCDALPPVTFDLGRPGWAPTLELTVHVRAVPAAGWLQVSHRTRNVAGGMFEEDCEVWDSAGRLVAQSRQLAMQPRG
jgi:acyl-CoA thioesterase